MTGESSFPEFLKAIERIADALEVLTEQLGTANRNLESITERLRRLG